MVCNENLEHYMVREEAREPKYRAYGYRYLLMAVHKAQARLEVDSRPSRAFVDCLSMLLFSAFALEAFVNHLGELSLQNWRSLKKNKSVREKLVLLADTHGVALDWDSYPYGSIKELVQFRNAVAHAETQDVSIEIISGAAGGKLPHWPSLCEPETAKRISGEVEQLIEDFPNRAGISMPRETLLAEPFEDDPD